MALPPLPENNTDRLFVHYTSGGGATAQNHVMTIRYNAATAQPFDILTDLGDTFAGLANEGDLFDGWSVLRAETQAQGAQVRLPVSVPANLLAVTGNGQANVTQRSQSREVRFIGRGLTSGRRVSMSLYGIKDGAIESEDYRFEPTPGSLLADLLLLIKGIGLTGAAWTTIAGDQTNWYPYVNYQANSHWETEQRA